MGVVYNSQNRSNHFFSPTGDIFQTVRSPRGNIKVVKWHGMDYIPPFGYVGMIRPETLVLGYEVVSGSEGREGITTSVHADQQPEEEGLLRREGYKPPFRFW